MRAGSRTSSGRFLRRNLGPRTSIPEGATVLIAIILSREQPGLLGLITLRGLRLVPPQFRPALHRWRARGPPEDYGGPGAYGSLPPALADPINQEQAEHPEAFDPAAKNGALERAAAEVGTWLFPLLVCVLRAELRIGEVLAPHRDTRERPAHRDGVLRPQHAVDAAALTHH